jgi:hypothetical protein
MISSLNWLLPAWIIGAPLVGAIVILLSTPKPDASFDRSHPQDRAALGRTTA